MAAAGWPKGQPKHVPPSNDGVTRVVRMKLYKGDVIQDCDVYIGRRNCMGGWNLPHSKWANPFKMKECNNDRQVATQRYKEYIMAKPELLNSLHELKGKRLGCWCKPEMCHGDVLLELVNKYCTEGGATAAGVTKADHLETKAHHQEASYQLDNDDFPSLKVSDPRDSQRDHKPFADTWSQPRDTTVVTEETNFTASYTPADSGCHGDVNKTTTPSGTQARTKRNRAKYRTPHLHKQPKFK